MLNARYSRWKIYNNIPEEMQIFVFCCFLVISFIGIIEIFWKKRNRKIDWIKVEKLIKWEPIGPMKTAFLKLDMPVKKHLINITMLI
ncbi:MAG: hypothetical protein JW891_17155 [Candidatus Lokiarchaeota archaeon]|nr:hypothetical protein [Candidatus Lokiarchaeota archaeon]